MKSTPSTSTPRPTFTAPGSSFDVRRSTFDVRRSLSTASRAVAALLGGYALAASASVALTLASSAPREDATANATAASFLLYAAAILWAFVARTAGRAWLGIALPTAFFAALACWLLDSVAP
jgi:hypothetical protein